MRFPAFRHEPGGCPGTVSIALAKRGVELECVDLFAGEQLPDVSNVAGLVFLGQGMCANEPIEFLRAELDLIRTATAAGQPILGICLGVQLIAKAFGR
jgi:GMP synthase (glutamine-hydrolysing)